MPKAATPQFLLLEIAVLTSFSRVAGATHEARFFLIAAFCRLAKSLSHSELMGWLVGAVGIEPLLWGMNRNAAESRSSEAHLGRVCSLEDSWI